MEENSFAEADSGNKPLDNETLFYKNAEQNPHLVTYISNLDEEESV